MSRAYSMSVPEMASKGAVASAGDPSGRLAFLMLERQRRELTNAEKQEYSSLATSQRFEHSLEPKEVSDYFGNKSYRFEPKPVAQPAAPPPESPYDWVGEYRDPRGRHYVPPRQRWELERDRRKGELEMRNAEAQAEQQRWAFMQMMKNADGMRIRELLYGGDK
jgi:hypothetical protein